MYIIIVGGGNVGHYLARALLEEGHEVLILEKRADKCERICNELGSVCFRGDGCEAMTLAEVGTGRVARIVGVELAIHISLEVRLRLDALDMRELALDAGL